MYKRGFIDGGALKTIVLERMAARVGLDGPGFDQWLAMPAAE